MTTLICHSSPLCSVAKLKFKLQDCIFLKMDRKPYTFNSSLQRQLKEPSDFEKQEFIHILAGLQRQCLLKGNVQLIDKTSLSSSPVSHSSRNKVVINSEKPNLAAARQKVYEMWLQRLGIEAHVCKFLSQSTAASPVSQSPWPSLRHTFPAPHHHLNPRIDFTSKHSPLHPFFHQTNYPTLYSMDSQRTHHQDKIGVCRHSLPHLDRGQLVWEENYRNSHKDTSESTQCDPLRPVPCAVQELVSATVARLLHCHSGRDGPVLRLHLNRSLNSASSSSSSSPPPAELNPFDACASQIIPQPQRPTREEDSAERRALLVRALGRHIEGLADGVLELVS